MRGDLETKINLLGKELVLLSDARAKALRREVITDNRDKKIRVSSKYTILCDNIHCEKNIMKIIRQYNSDWYYLQYIQEVYTKY